MCYACVFAHVLSVVYEVCVPVCAHGAKCVFNGFRSRSVHFSQATVCFCVRACKIMVCYVYVYVYVYVRRAMTIVLWLPILLRVFASIDARRQLAGHLFLSGAF